MSFKNLLLKVPVFRKIRVAYRRQKAIRNYTSAAESADKAYKKTGTRHFVIMLTNGKLAIFCRSTFRKHIRKGWLPGKNYTINDAIRDCVYRTPTQCGNDYLSPEETVLRRNQYIRMYSEM